VILHLQLVILVEHSLLDDLQEVLAIGLLEHYEGIDYHL
jgi:hypothetical protein